MESINNITEKDFPWIISVQVGKLKYFESKTLSAHENRQCLTGFYKEPVAGKIWAGNSNLSDDSQADLENHGGTDKAVLAYSADHYPVWRKELSLPDLPNGGFGENLTIVGMTEETVCIGDTYVIGDVLLQVSQPRRPCWKISRRWQIDDLADRVKNTGRIGWYFRVLKEGFIENGLPVVLLERPYPQWTVERSYEIMKNRRSDTPAAQKLATCNLLSVNWRTKLVETKRWDTIRKGIKGFVHKFKIDKIV